MSHSICDGDQSSLQGVNIGYEPRSLILLLPNVAGE